MKSIFMSKTFWTNAATAVAWMAAQSWVADHPQLSAAAGVAAAVVNIALRFVTKVPVSL